MAPGWAWSLACVEMLGPLVGGLDRHVAALVGGDGVGWHELGEQYWHGADALPGCRCRHRDGFGAGRGRGR